MSADDLETTADASVVPVQLPVASDHASDGRYESIAVDAALFRRTLKNFIAHDADVSLLPVAGTAIGVTDAEGVPRGVGVCVSVGDIVTAADGEPLGDLLDVTAPKDGDAVVVTVCVDVLVIVTDGVGETLGVADGAARAYSPPSESVNAITGPGAMMGDVWIAAPFKSV